MNIEEIENRIEQFRQYLEKTVAIREDFLLNAPDPRAGDIYVGMYRLAKIIDQEFAEAFPTKLTVKTDEQT